MKQSKDLRKNQRVKSIVYGKYYGKEGRVIKRPQVNYTPAPSFLVKFDDVERLQRFYWYQLEMVEDDDEDNADL